MASPYVFQNGDQLAETTFSKIPTYWLFAPYGGPLNHVFCPQAATRGQSDGDYPPGYVSNPKQIGSNPILKVVGIVTNTKDPYEQGNVYAAVNPKGGPTFQITIPTIFPGK